ncbi:hypothetical protein OOU_Y34scaffold00291g4 [Pyricularia oryzae Y34]|uniref:Uncharacterized protein n=2 Tax=Pyricularia oryzae TaxID=318829 RepID=A0AA97P3C7_PYRO3|nr:hypothetical protein OOU_Y34scaffold00291g4 [Pyricularia oryzae Y34]
MGWNEEVILRIWGVILRGRSKYPESLSLPHCCTDRLQY